MAGVAEAAYWLASEPVVLREDHPEALRVDYPEVRQVDHQEDTLLATPAAVRPEVHLVGVLVPFAGWQPKFARVMLPLEAAVEVHPEALRVATFDTHAIPPAVVAPVVADRAIDTVHRLYRLQSFQRQS